MEFKIILLSMFIIATTIISQYNFLRAEDKGSDFEVQVFQIDESGVHSAREYNPNAPSLNCNVIFKDADEAVQIITLLTAGTEVEAKITSKSHSLEVSKPILCLFATISLIMFLIN